MAGIVPTLTNGSFHNWLKGALGVFFAKEGLTEFVSTEFREFHRDLLNSISASPGIPAGTTCNSCTTANLLKCHTQGFCNPGHCKLHDPAIPEKIPNQPCPNRVCDAFMIAIRKKHRYKGPSWKNTDARSWCKDPFEVAKCYLPPDGYFDIHSFEETDFNGVLSVIINNKRFQSKLAAQLNTDPNNCTKVRDIGKAVRHSPDLLLNDADLAQYIIDLINLLTDTIYLASDLKAQAAVNKLKELQANTLTIHANDITKVIHDNLGRSISTQHQAVLQDIQKHLCVVKTASIDAIDEIITAKLTALDEIHKETELKKTEINVHTGQKKQDFDEHAGSLKKSIDVLGDQKKQDIDVHADHKKQDIDNHVDQKKQDTEVHIDQKKQDIDMHADQKKQDIDVHADQKKQDLDLYTDQKKQEIAVLGKQEVKTGSQIKEEEYAGFQSELIKMYRKYNSKIPMSPLAEEHDVPLVDLYVEPPMSAIDLQQWRGDQQGNPVKTPVNDYKELFFLHGENAFKNIYITANAGVGKTSFSCHLCLTWCQAHDPEEHLSHHFRKENLQALKFFEFVFLIPLREAQRSLCDVDKFIYELVQNRLPNIKSSRELVDDILKCKSCLVILDGLDEWVHPKCERSHKKSDIPHAKCWSGSTIITTSRPWKFDVIRLPSSKVDRHVEICELDRKSSRRLVVKAIKLLNDRSTLNKPEMKNADFHQATSGLNLGNLSDNPYINLQIVSLWHDGENIGRSKCEIFTNIVELTLERGLAKHGHGPISAVTPVICNKPKCLICRHQCLIHFAVLYNLGKLAFFALFGVEQESALIIDRSVALQYLDSEEELEFCLKLGLLSQNKDYRFVSRQQSKVSFQHKTFQEYFSALYIQSDTERKNSREHILKKCNILDSVLEMSNVFLFLSGMNPEVYNCMFEEITDILSSDKTVSSYRDTPIPFNKITVDEKSVFTFQTLQKDCMQEIKMNGHINCFPPIEDVIIHEESKHEEYLSLLVPIVSNHCGRIKSLRIHRTDDEYTECAQILHRLNIRSLSTLEMLCFYSAVERDDLEHLLKQNLKTVRFLAIYNEIYRDKQYFRKMTSLSRECLANIKNMPYLQNLHLGVFSMRHNILKEMFDYITNRDIMTVIILEYITCEDHGDSCSGFMLDLSRHVNLRSICLHRVRIHQLHVNTERLEDCSIGLLPTGEASSWLRKIAASPIIHKLYCVSLSTDDLSTLIEILPTFLNLKELYIQVLTLGDLQLPISPEMNSLHGVDLFLVSLNCSVLRELVDSVSRLAQPVLVRLRDCAVTPPEEYNTIKTEIKTSKTFHVQFDGMNKRKREEFRFSKL